MKTEVKVKGGKVINQRRGIKGLFVLKLRGIEQLNFHEDDRISAAGSYWKPMNWDAVTHQFISENIHGVYRLPRSFKLMVITGWAMGGGRGITWEARDLMHYMDERMVNG